MIRRLHYSSIVRNPIPRIVVHDFDVFLFSKPLQNPFGNVGVNPCLEFDDYSLSRVVVSQRDFDDFLDESDFE
jgi:hypothetical protein